MKRINLSISNKFVAVTGRENGQEIAKKDILPFLNTNILPVVVVFPDYITTVGSSYIEGIEDVLSLVLTTKQIREQVGYISKDETICREVTK